MADQEAKSASAVWILRSRGDTSDEIRGRLEAVALRLWPKAEAWAQRQMRESSVAEDSAVIWDVWEESLQSVLRTLERKTRLRPVRDLDSYVFGIFCHRMRQRIEKEKRLQFVPLAAEAGESQSVEDWPAELENKLLLQEALKQTDEWTKRALYRRTVMGNSWGEIGRMCGIGERAAMKRFGYRIKKLREAIGATEKNMTKRA